MEEIDARLTEAEQVKANWTPVQDLVIDSLSEQMDDLKVTTATVHMIHCDLFRGSLSLFRVSLVTVTWVLRNRAAVSVKERCVTITE